MKLQTTFSTEVFSVRRLAESVKMDQGVRKRLSDSCESLGAAVDCTSKGRKVRKMAGADARFLYCICSWHRHRVHRTTKFVWDPSTT